MFTRGEERRGEERRGEERRGEEVALFPGHSQILSCSHGETFSPRLRDKIWEWPGNEAREEGEEERKRRGGEEGKEKKGRENSHAMCVS